MPHALFPLGRLPSVLVVAAIATALAACEGSASPFEPSSPSKPESGTAGAPDGAPASEDAGLRAEDAAGPASMEDAEGPSALDATRDAGPEALPDASADAAVELDAGAREDAGSDPSPDARVDAQVEPPDDAGGDGTMGDATPADAGPGGMTDATPDADGTLDASDDPDADAPSDAAVDAGEVVEPEVPWPPVAQRLAGRQLAVGRAHGCSLDPAISGVLCWGDDSHGQIQVPTLDDPTFLAAGGDVSCVIDAGTVRCWGDASQGLLDVPALSAPATQLAVGAHHACALLQDATLACWGSDEHGQAQPPALEGVRTLGVGDRHACALAVDGVHCWGDDSLGQLDVPALPGPTRLAVGENHACAIAAGAVHCWGGEIAALREAVPALQDPFAVAAGASHSCAIDTQGVHCWGDPAARDLTPRELTWPLQVAVGGAGARAFACARHLQGVVCWGDPSLGQTAYDGEPLHLMYDAASVIEAPAALVWDVLMDLDRYPEWNPYTTAMESTLEVGDPMNMTVRMNALVTLDQTEHIRLLEPGHKVCWGIETDTPAQNAGERCQWLEPISDTRTRYVTEDLIEGTLNPLVSLLFGGDVEAGFDAVARSLKERAESLYVP